MFTRVLFTLVFSFISSLLFETKRRVQKNTLKIFSVASKLISYVTISEQIQLCVRDLRILTAMNIEFFLPCCDEV
jgi:hypothetical protein